MTNVTGDDTPTTDTTTDIADGKNDNDSKDSDDKKDISVPSRRLKDEADKRRQAEESAKALADKLAAYEAKEKQAEEAESLKRGEYEKIVKEKNDELESYRQKDESYKEKDQMLQSIVDQQLEEFKKTYGEETYEQIK